MAQDDVDPLTVPACARCGGPAEHDFVTLWLCTDCYHVAGSTCAGVQVLPPVEAGRWAADSGHPEQADAVC